MIWLTIMVLIAVVETRENQNNNHNSKECSSSFLSDLNLSGTKVFKFSKRGTPNSTCGSEWVPHGTCCDLDSLKRTYFNEVAQTTQSVHNILAWANKALSRSRNADKVANNQDFLQKVDICYASFYIALSQVEKSNNFDTLNASAIQCWDHMNQIRGSALCSICSGRFETFLKGKKGLVDLNSCKNTVQICRDFLKLSQDLTNNLLKAANLGKGCHSDREGFKKITKKVEKLGKLLQANSLPNNFQNALKEIQGSQEPEKTQKAITICESILNIRKQTLVEYLDNEVVSKSPDLSSLTPDGEASRQLGMAKRQNWFISRYLDSSLSLSAGNPFTSDTQVFLAGQDNMFHSYDGASGTTLDHETTYKQPMNLTIPFP